MFKKSLIALSLAAPLLMTQPVHARDFGAIYTDCGIGGMVGSQIGDRSVGNVLAIVSNFVTTFGAVAIISDISSPETCSGGSAAVAAFIHQSYDALEQDLASGEGNYLAALKTLSGGGEAFETDLRTAFADKVTNTDYEQLSHYDKSESLYNLVHGVI